MALWRKAEDYLYPKWTLTGRNILGLTLLLCLCIQSGQSKLADGGVLFEDETIEASDNILVKKDTIVSSGVTLTLKPGVKLRFGPGVMLAVNGTLLAEVGKCFRITLLDNVVISLGIILL